MANKSLRKGKCVLKLVMSPTLGCVNVDNKSYFIWTLIFLRASTCDGQ
jgi:hypothetical protein